MIILVRDNSISRLTGLTPGQLASVRRYVAIEDVKYSKFNKLYARDAHRIRQTKQGPAVKDAKGRYCALSDRATRRYTDYPKLRTAMAQPNAYCYYSGYALSRIPLISKSGEFMSGLVYMVEEWAKNQGVTLTIEDHRVRPKSTLGMFSLELPAPFYPEQLEAIRAAVLHEQGTIEAATGFGKSFTMLGLVNRLQMKTLIVCPNLNLKTQLRETFLKAFGSLKNITIENIDSPTLKNAGSYDLLIVDEAHHSAASTYRKLNAKVWGNIFHRVFFTATPYRNLDSELLLMVGIAGQVIYRVPYAKALSRGYVAPVEAYFYELPKTKTTGTTWPTVYKELVVDNEYRNNLIASLITSLHSNSKSTLVLVKEVAHGQKLSDLTGAAFAHGEGEDCQQLIKWFSEGKLSSLIATTGVAGEGCDTKAAEYVILAGLGKSKPAFLQQVGRGVRKYPGKSSCKVILFSDGSHKWPAEHFQAQATYLQDEFKTIPVQLDLPAAI